jgi:hypothetical protein
MAWSEKTPNDCARHGHPRSDYARATEHHPREPGLVGRPAGPQSSSCSRLESAPPIRALVDKTGAGIFDNLWQKRVAIIRRLELRDRAVGSGYAVCNPAGSLHRPDGPARGRRFFRTLIPQDGMVAAGTRSQPRQGRLALADADDEVRQPGGRVRRVRGARCCGTGRPRR